MDHLQLQGQANEAVQRLKRRKLAGLSAALYVGVLLAFFLPFASASCTEVYLSTAGGSAESETLTGWELALGQEPTIRTEGPVQSETVQDVRDTLAAIGASATLLAVVTLISLVLAMVLVATCNEGWAAALLASGGASALAFAVVYMSRYAGNADVQFHSGYWLALALGGGALGTDAWLTGELRLQPGKRPGCLISAVAILGLVMVISGLIMLAARIGN
jgi:hypothetical protein